MATCKADGGLQQGLLPCKAKGLAEGKGKKEAGLLGEIALELGLARGEVNRVSSGHTLPAVDIIAKCTVE